MKLALRLKLLVSMYIRLSDSVRIIASILLQQVKDYITQDLLKIEQADYDITCIQSAVIIATLYRKYLSKKRYWILKIVNPYQKRV